MSKIRRFVTKKWCALLTSLLIMLGFQACHHAQKVVTDENITNQKDSSNIKNKKNAPAIQDKDIICLYGVPPSMYQEIKEQ